MAIISIFLESSGNISVDTNILLHFCSPNSLVFIICICFLIDYRCNLPLLWTCIFCLFYAIFGFQNYIDIQHMDNNAQLGFMFFSGIGILLLIFSGLTWINFVNNIWLFIWMNILYIPITSFDDWAKQ